MTEQIRETVKANLKTILNRKIKPKEILNIEISIYNSTISHCKNNNIICNWENNIFKNIYLQKAISIYSNIKEHSNNLIPDIKNKKIKSEDIAFLKPQELNPENWHELLTKYKDKLDSAYETKFVSMSDKIVCRKCKSREIVYYEFQSRKADEGSSTAYTCLSCNFKWKKN
jgi:DNA-directed RNA polymerase subunit M/transcription elongation factor TFIIS